MVTSEQCAVITGGGGVLAREVAAGLARLGWRIKTPTRHELDVRDGAAVRSYFERFPTDLLVCAAGLTRDAPMARIDESMWDETWGVNFNGARLCAEAVLPGMIARGGGHIVFISSHSAKHPPIGQTAYATAKAALLGLTADLAARHGAFNIRVNAVLPGFMETRMTQALTEARRAEVLGEHSLGRFNTCREAAAFIRYLHHELPHTSGQVFQLDSRPDFP